MSYSGSAWDHYNHSHIFCLCTIVWRDNSYVSSIYAIFSIIFVTQYEFTSYFNYAVLVRLILLKCLTKLVIASYICQYFTLVILILALLKKETSFWCNWNLYVSKIQLLICTALLVIYTWQWIFLLCRKYFSIPVYYVKPLKYLMSFLKTTLKYIYIWTLLVAVI